MENQTKRIISKSLQISGTVILVVLLLLCIPFSIPKLMGYHTYHVVTESMEPTFPVDSIIYVEDADASDIEEGDVITFSLGTATEEVLTHRVTQIDTENDVFRTKGDANDVEDNEPVAFSRLIGKPVMSIPILGKMAFLFQGWTGYLILFVGIALVLGLWLAGDFIKRCCLDEADDEETDDNEMDGDSDKEFSKEDEEDDEVLEEKKTKKKKVDFVNLGIFVVGAILIIVAAVKLISTKMDYNASNNLYNSLEEEFVTYDVNVDDSKEWYELLRVDMEGLQEKNPDIKGWIFFENEEISYPIVYSGDNEKYIRTSVDGAAATAGSIFLEGMNSSDFEDSHTIIYGHNMQNLSMFGRLKNYKEKDYYEDHQYFQILVDGKIYRYQIFAYHDVSETSDLYTVPFAPDATFENFINQVLCQGNYIDSGITPTKEDKIITLSTCSSEGNRFVVHAFRVDEYNTATDNHEQE